LKKEARPNALRMEEQMSAKLLPQSDSIQELARFWDVHDLTDFAEELEEVSEPVFEREMVVKVHLPIKEAEAVKRIAESTGIDYADLIREWVVEKAQAA
jgi:predicted DNA binding CopG/RHH family protein